MSQVPLCAGTSGQARGTTPTDFQSCATEASAYAANAIVMDLIMSMTQSPNRWRAQPSRYQVLLPK